MLDHDDLINYELCFPGAVTGQEENNKEESGRVHAQFQTGKDYREGLPGL